MNSASAGHSVKPGPELSGPVPLDLVQCAPTVPGAASSAPAALEPEPTRLAVGLGLRPGLPAERILAALREALPGARIACLATIDRRAAEPGLRRAATVLGVPVHGFTPDRLATVVVPNPSARVVAAVGVAGVAESAALLAGTGALTVPRRVVSGLVIAAAVASGDDPRS